MKKHRHHHGERGFTLVEIMAVVFVIGIIVGLAALSIGGHSERLFATEAQRLFQKIRLVAEEAEFSKKEYGMGIVDDQSYIFFEFDDQLMEWVKVDKDNFKAVELDDGFKLELDTSENKLDTSVLYNQPQKEAVTDYGEKSLEEPDIIFFSDGEITPFELSISNSTLSKKIFRVYVNGQSELVLEQKNK